MVPDRSSPYPPTPVAAGSPTPPFPSGLPTVVHIGLLVEDLPAAVAFYAEGLGAVPDPKRGTDTFQALQLAGGTVLGLHTVSSWRDLGLDVVAAALVPAQVLVAYQVGSAEEVDRLTGRLVERGAGQLRAPHEAYGQRLAVLADLDGHAVCLSWPQPDGTPGEGR